MFRKLFPLKKTERKALVESHTSDSLPEDVLLSIFYFFPIKELASIPVLSKKWQSSFNHSSFWSGNYYKHLKDFLNLALFNAIKNKKSSEIIFRYCLLGANVNCYFKDCISKKYNWSETCVSFFTKVTPLSIAANRASGQYGKDVIKLLLQFGANPALKSIYSVRWFQGATGSLTSEQFFEETPDKSALTKEIKFILLMAKHQFFVKHDSSNVDITSSLQDLLKIAGKAGVK